MKVTRIIHPVGQGGFYTETLSNGTQEATFVYDCGGFDKAKSKMAKYLDSFLPKGKPKKQIEAVFISHFHADHINGLQYLLENAEVKYLFLPQLTEEVLVGAMVYNYYTTKQSNWVNNFLLKLYRGDARFGSEERPTRIIQVDYSNDSRVPENFGEDVFTEDSLELRAWNWSLMEAVDLSAIDIFPANAMLHCSKWLYIPYNSKVIQKKKDDLKKELGKLLGADVTVENLPSLLENHTVKACKEIYDKVFGSQQNHTSMTLFSGTLEKTLRRRCKGLSECGCYHHCDYLVPYRYCCNPNFLYTGDFEPEKNVEGMRDFYDTYWRKIASVQVPHHGSVNNYNSELYKYPVRGIVSVGNDNTYYHPNIDTLINIQSMGCHPVIVTEDKSSMRIYHYSF